MRQAINFNLDSIYKTKKIKLEKFNSEITIILTIIKANANNR